MRPRDVARAAKRFAAQEARATRATWRGNVESVFEDGAALVVLPNGGKVKVYPSNLVEWGINQSVSLLRTGNSYEVLGQSAYQGGMGAPFDPGE